MGRRAVLLIVALVIAALGATMIFLYVQGIDQRAEAGQRPVEVLAASAKIEAGETIEAAQGAGKLELVSVPREDLLPGALTSTESLAGKVALTAIFPKEQIIPEKFGASGTEQTITIPDGAMAVSVQLTDPARVAGFITPGSKVAIFYSADGGAPADAGAPAGTETAGGDAAAASDTGAPALVGGFTRLLLPDVQVIGVGTTSVLSTTTTDETGAATTEQLPKTLLTLALTQDQAEKVIFATRNGELALGLLNGKSKVRPGPGVDATSMFD